MLTGSGLGLVRKLEPHGLTLVTSRERTLGEIVFSFKGSMCESRTRHSLQIKDHELVRYPHLLTPPAVQDLEQPGDDKNPDTAWVFLNHSFMPNLRLMPGAAESESEGIVQAMALKDIPSGTPLTFDYW